MGTADELPTAPVTKTMFVEDMTESQLAQAASARFSSPSSFFLLGTKIILIRSMHWLFSCLHFINFTLHFHDSFNNIPLVISYSAWCHCIYCLTLSGVYITVQRTLPFFDNFMELVLFFCGQQLELPAGLTNLGNTCYLNATLQCLHSVPELRDSLKK